jgi:hypothetical protein
LEVLKVLLVMKTQPGIVAREEATRACIERARLVG